MRIAEFTSRLNEGREEYLVSKGYRKATVKGRLPSPGAIAAFIREAYGTDALPGEHCWLLCMDTKLKPIGVFELSRGSEDGTVMEPRQAYRMALMGGATKVALIHNHPSGDCTPSNADARVTERMASAGKIIGVEFIDHIVLGNGCYHSHKESMPWLWEKVA